MVEWSITAVLKTAVPKGTGGSNPSLSAMKGVNQRVVRFTPFSTPENLPRRLNTLKLRTILSVSLESKKLTSVWAS